MRKLLRAGVFRLFRSASLWISCAIMAGVQIAVLAARYRDVAEFAVVSSIDGSFFNYAGLAGFLIAIVGAFLTGPEYGDGTIRNKLAVGCARRDIYLSELLLLCLASFVLCLSAVVPALAVGVPLLGGFKMGALRASLTVFGTFAMCLAWSGLFTLLFMLIDHRTDAAVAALALVVATMVLGVYLQARLEAPPTVTGYVLSVNGQMVPSDPLPNPAYIPEGPVRRTIQFLFDLLPGCQSVQYASAEAGRPLALTGLSALVFALSTLAGLAAFRRKNIK